MRTFPANNKFKTYLMWVTPFIFSIRQVILLSNHELWRDEIQAWLIAFNSDNLAQLVANLRYEGRPPLWHILIWLVTRFSSNPEFLKVLSGAIFFITIFVFYRLRAFSYLIKIAITFGFYFSYGYSVVSRDYNLILLFCISLLYIKERNLNPKFSYFICLLLSLTNPFGSVIAIFWIIINSEIRVAYSREFIKKIKKIILESFPILFIIMYFRMPTDSIFQPNLDLGLKRFLTALSASVIKPFFPFPDTHTISALDVLLGLLILFLLFLIFLQLDHNLKLALMIAGSALLLNALVGYSLYWWHFGASYLLFLIAVAVNFERRNNFKGSFLFRFSICLLVSFQILGSVFGIGKDFSANSNYSNIRKTAEYISLKYPGATIISESQVFGTPLYAYLKPTQVYFPSIQNYAQFTSWKKSEFRDVTQQELIEAALKFDNSLIVTSYFPEISDRRVRKVESFSGAVWGDNFEIYELKKQ